MVVYTDHPFGEAYMPDIGRVLIQWSGSQFGNIIVEQNPAKLNHYKSPIATIVKARIEAVIYKSVFSGAASVFGMFINDAIVQNRPTSSV